MTHSAGGSGGDDRKGLAAAFRFLLTSDHPPASSAGNQHQTEPGAGADDLQRLLSTARQDRGSDPELRHRLDDMGGTRQELDRDRIEASEEAILILDAHRYVRCASVGARRLLALGPETTRIFDYFFQPGQPQLVTIERPDRTAGVGRLLAVATRWEGGDAYLVRVRDVTHQERDHMAAPNRGPRAPSHPDS